MTEPTSPGDRPLHVLDEQAARLRERWPGWRVWYVPRAGRGAFWSAQPARYPLMGGSADELAGLIDADRDGPATS